LFLLKTSLRCREVFLFKCASRIFASSTCVSPHPLKGSTVLEFEIPLQGIGAKAKIWDAPYLERLKKTSQYICNNVYT